MERVMDTKFEKTTIYEIFRACRLCGAGGGYKMPIIQSVVNIVSDVDLKQKIKECVQIEVHHDDRMPPLICELCVDKVNDFYEFLDMCRQTNRRTRQRLGLPMHTQSVGTTDEDCILGVTEQVYTKDDSESNLRSQTKRLQNEQLRGIKVKKESELRVRLECINDQVKLAREKNAQKFKKGTKRGVSPKRGDSPKRGRSLKRGDSPKRVDSPRRRSPRRGRSPKSVDSPKRVDSPRRRSPRRRSSPKSGSSSGDSPAPRSLRHSVREDQSSSQKDEKNLYKPSPKGILKKELKVDLKRPRELDAKPGVTIKKVKLKVASPPRVLHSGLRCGICKNTFKNQSALRNHIKRHNVTYTKSDDNENKPWAGEPDVRCGKCSRQFATRALRDQHACHAQRSAGPLKCPKCHRTFSMIANLKRHEKLCSVRKTREVVLDAALVRSLRPLQVRVARCDPLLRFTVGDHYDVSTVIEEFGLDEKCVYPYVYTARYRVKAAPLMYDGMVSIKGELDYDYDEKYIHWDSESESDAESVSLISNAKEVPSLTALTLKTIFSYKLLGKVPRKRRKIKVEKDSFYDSMLNTDADTTIRSNIDNIIDNLSDDTSATKTDIEGDKVDSRNVFNTSADDMFPENKEKQVTNDDFDVLFNKDNENTNDDKKNEGKNDLEKATDAESPENKIIHEESNDTTSQNSLSEKMDVSDDVRNESADSVSVVVNKTHDAIETSIITATVLNNINDCDNAKTFGEKCGNLGKVQENSNNKTSINDTAIENDDKPKGGNLDSNLHEPKRRESEINGQKEKASKLGRQEVSDADMEDKKLLDAIDEQIGESTKCDDSSPNKKYRGSSMKSLDLDNISDEELNFDC